MIESALLHHHESRQWLSFEQPVAVLHARKATEVLPLLNEIEARVEAERLTAVGYVTYEAARGLDASLPTQTPPDDALHSEHKRPGKRWQQDCGIHLITSGR